MILGMTWKQTLAYLAVSIPAGLILDWSVPQTQPFELTHFLATTIAVALMQAAGAIFYSKGWK